MKLLPVSKLRRSLLATTALTVASGTAVASTITEGTVPAPVDFANSPNGFLLPNGTTQVIGLTGFANESFDNSDWFTFQNLGTGTFTLSGFGDAETFNSYIIQTSGGTQLASGFLSNGSQTLLSGAIPIDGQLVVGIFQAEEVGGGYTIDLSAQSGVPEPSTLATAGLALGGALAWRRKRSAN